MKSYLTLAVSVLLGAVTLNAHAQQPWLADRRYGEGIGVRAGNLEFHPGVSAEAGYDSNYFLRAPSEDPLSVYRFRLTPAFTVSTLTQRRLERDGGLPPPPSLTFRGGAYVALNGLVATDSSRSDDLRGQRVPWDLGADVLFNIMPQARVGEDVYANFVRSAQPSNLADPDVVFDRDSIRTGAGVTWRPGGGLFDWRLGYEFQYNYFEQDSFKTLNNYNHTINMRGRWRFLPRTAVLYDGGYTWIRYATNRDQSDGAIVRSRIGINGLISTRLSALAMIGWAGSFYDQRSGQPKQEFDSVVGQAELKWFITGGEQAMNQGSAPVGLSYASIGYLRDVSSSYLGNVYRRDRGYVGFSYLLGGVLITTLNVGVSNLAFPTTFFDDGTVVHDAFSTQRLDASLFTEYRLSDRFGVNATVNYDRNFTDVRLPVDASGAGIPDDLAFSRWQVFLGARYFL